MLQKDKNTTNITKISTFYHWGDFDNKVQPTK